MSITVNGTNGLTFNDGSAQNTAATGFGFKNRIINGAMMIDQRNAGASVTPTNAQYSVDRWAAVLTQASKFTMQQNAGSVTPPVGFTNYLGITSSSAYSVLTGDAFGFYQWVEGFNCADLAWGTANAQTVTLSFLVRSSLTGTFGGSIINNAANRSYVFSYTISAANTWEQKTITIAGDQSGTWLTNNGAGIMVRYGIGSGSTFTGTAGSWGAGNIVQPTGSVSVVGTSGATFYITGVQLEKGSTATSFDYRPYGTELALCQRYYAKTFPQGTAPAQNAGVGGAVGGQDSGSGAYGSQLQWRFPVTMRASPTVVSYNPSAANSNIRNTALNTDCTTVASNITTSDSETSLVGVSSTPTAGTNLAVHFTASAEL
jgi:hypothetical protein